MISELLNTEAAITEALVSKAADASLRCFDSRLCALIPLE